MSIPLLASAHTLTNRTKDIAKKCQALPKTTQENAKNERSTESPSRCQHVGVRVLVIDDEELIARSIEQALASEGYVVDVEHRGDTGLWRAKETSYDAIICDVMLPGLNGFAVCRELRAGGITTPVLMLSAKDGDFDQAEGLDMGADGYLTKPFSLVVLLAHVRALVRRGPATRSPTLRAGDLAVDPSARTCVRGSTIIELTPREFTLLHELMRDTGVTIAKRDLIERVWAGEILEADVLQVYVGYLRRKIDEPFGRSAIETVRGFGYRLRADGG